VVWLPKSLFYATQSMLTGESILAQALLYDWNWHASIESCNLLSHQLLECSFHKQYGTLGKRVT
jgi:hypothetical protein